MIELLQQNNNLIGSLEAIENLKNKDHARILVISDSHGGYSIFSKIIQQFGPDCDGMIFCGDGHNDIIEILQHANQDKAFRDCIPPVLAFVQGNCDPGLTYVNFNIAVDAAAKAIPPRVLNIPTTQILTVNGQNIYITHGYLEDIDYTHDKLARNMQFADCKIGFHGHTHVPRQLILDDYKIVNPGSITRPRGGKPACFAILTVEKTFSDVAFIRLNNFIGNETSFKIISLA